MNNRLIGFKGKRNHLLRGETMNLRMKIQAAGGLYTLADLARHWGVSPQRVSELAGHPSFPEPIMTGGDGTGTAVYVGSEAEAFRQAERRPGRPPGPQEHRAWGKIGRGKQTRAQRATFERLRTSSAFRAPEGVIEQVTLHRTGDPMEVVIGDRVWRVDPDGREERIVDPGVDD